MKRSGIPQSVIRNPQLQNGFTLIEAIMTTVIVSIVGVIIVYALAAGVNAYIVALDRENALGPIRVAIARLEKDLRETATIKTVTAANAATFTYRGLDYYSGTNDFQVSYSYAGGTLSRTANGSTNALISGITSFAFDYKDINDASVSPVVSPAANFRYIDVTMTVLAGSKSESMQTKICPRTFRD